MTNKDDIPKRPVDLIFPGRREAIAGKTCIPAPAGCGGDATEFKDEISKREFRISGLCQTCQDAAFFPSTFDVPSESELEDKELD